MDAGWYPFKSGWWKTGTWDVDPGRFPHGFTPISEAAHARGVKIIVWFEPERVTAGSWLWENHPEWLIGTNEKDKLLFLGDAKGADLARRSCQQNHRRAGHRHLSAGFQF